MIVLIEIVVIVLITCYGRNECSENNGTTSDMYESKNYTTTMTSERNTSTPNTSTSPQPFLDNNTVTIPDTESNNTTTAAHKGNRDTITTLHIENSDKTTSQSVENIDTFTFAEAKDNDTTTTYNKINNGTTATSYIVYNDTTITPSQVNNFTEESSSRRNTNTYTQPATSDSDSMATASMLNYETTAKPFTLNNDNITTPVSMENNANTTLSMVDNNASILQSTENTKTNTGSFNRVNDSTNSPPSENNNSSKPSLFWNNDTVSILATGNIETTATFPITNNDTTTRLNIENNETTSMLSTDNTNTYTKTVKRHTDTTTTSAPWNNYASTISSTEKNYISTAFPADTTMLFLIGDTKTTAVPLNNNETSMLSSTISAADTTTLPITWDKNTTELSTEAYTETTISSQTHDNIPTTIPLTQDNKFTNNLSPEATTRKITPFQPNITATTITYYTSVDQTTTQLTTTTHVDVIPTTSYTSVGKTTTQLSTTELDVSTLSSTAEYKITASPSGNNVKTVTTIAQIPTGIGSTVPTSLKLSTTNTAATTARKADLGTVIGINLKISLNMTYTDKYKNTTTKPFTNTTEKIARHLTNLYKNIPRFVSITIKRLLPGSIVIDFDVNTILFNSSSSPSEIGELLKNETLQLDKNSTLGDFPLTQSYITTTTIQILQTEISNKIDSKDYLICGAGRAIREGTCVKICDFQENKCLHGTCFSHTNGTANCVCEEGDSYVYSGPQCAAKTEKLKWESKYIIAAAGGSGGFIIVIAFACCIICRGRGTKDNVEKDYFIGKQDTLSYNHPTGLLGLNRVPSSLYFATRDSTYNIDNRRYSVIKDKDNRSNTYIYNPSAETSRYPENESSSGQTYYNSSFCDEEFAIKRPHLKSGMDDNYKDYNRTNIHRPGYT